MNKVHNYIGKKIKISSYSAAKIPLKDLKKIYPDIVTLKLNDLDWSKIPKIINTITRCSDKIWRGWSVISGVCRHYEHSGGSANQRQLWTHECNKPNSLVCKNILTDLKIFIQIPKNNSNHTFQLYRPGIKRAIIDLSGKIPLDWSVFPKKYTKFIFTKGKAYANEEITDAIKIFIPSGYLRSDNVAYTNESTYESSQYIYRRSVDKADNIQSNDGYGMTMNFEVINLPKKSCVIPFPKVRSKKSPVPVNKKSIETKPFFPYAFISYEDYDDDYEAPIKFK